MTKRILGTALVLLSACCLYLDKIITIELKNTYAFNTSTDFFWMLGISICPAILIIGILLKPYKISLIIPLLVSITQVVFIFSPSKIDESTYWQWFYGIIFTIFSLLVTYLITIIFREEENKSMRIQAIENMLDLQKKIYLRTTSKN